jgi:hypothetical protein
MEAEDVFQSTGVLCAVQFHGNLFCQPRGVSAAQSPDGFVLFSK